MLNSTKMSGLIVVGSCLGERLLDLMTTRRTGENAFPEKWSGPAHTILPSKANCQVLNYKKKKKKTQPTLPDNPRDPQVLNAHFAYFQTKGVKGIILETWDDWTEGTEFEPDVVRLFIYCSVL